MTVNKVNNPGKRPKTVSCLHWVHCNLELSCCSVLIRKFWFGTFWARSFIVDCRLWDFSAISLCIRNHFSRNGLIKLRGAASRSSRRCCKAIINDRPVYWAQFVFRFWSSEAKAFGASQSSDWDLHKEGTIRKKNNYLKKQTKVN